ncbi:hypothetical protein O3P69_016323 [Scylla paramamosain]|uniref:Glutathione peroxidase n=1 Tax=Scylla paramamosain TaxID=85552 RepID=A0AAW0TE57_SCYPA
MNVLQDTLQDFEILAFPCNQFGMQEPGASGEEIMKGVEFVRPGGGFQPSFTMFSRVEVNGKNEHPLFTFLKDFCPSTRETFADEKHLYYSPLKNNDVRWNWEKFLVTRSGKPYMRYDPTTKPEDIRNDIMFLLQQDA